MEEEVRAVLLADAGVSALSPTGIGWGEHSAGGMPYIVLMTVSDGSLHVLREPSGTFEKRIQVDCYARTYGQMKVLCRAVIAALDGHQSGGIQSCFFIAGRDMLEPDLGAAHRGSLDFKLFYRT